MGPPAKRHPPAGATGPQPRVGVYWKPADERNRPYFPLGRPMFFDVVVGK